MIRKVSPKLINQLQTAACKLAIPLLLLLPLYSNAAIQKEGDDVDFTATAGAKNSLFKNGSSITYNVNIANNLSTRQVGKVSYRILSLQNKLLAEDSIKVNVGSKGIKHFELSTPARPAGFYKINLMINVTDYDDTIRRAFGVDPEQIRSAHDKPADFDQFWNNTKAELAAVKPNYKITEYPDSSRDNRRLYLVEMQSLDNITVRGWLTIPKTTEKNKKFCVMLGLPGYQVDLKPGFGLDPDIAVFFLNVRGQGNSRDVIHTSREDFITYHLDDKNKYVMRGVIMDCVRAVDFICSRPELDHTRILVTGGSMGGYLTAALAGLDDRVCLYSAQNPILCDIRNLVGETNWPFYDIKQYVKIRPGLTFDKVLDNLDYYDAKNFATNIHRPILVGMGLLDPLAPPPNEYVFFNNIAAKDKRLMSFENLGHEVPMAYVIYQGKWMRDSFSLF